MLVIEDSKDLKEKLEKFGFSPRYNMLDGEIDEYILERYVFDKNNFLIRKIKTKKLKLFKCGKDKPIWEIVKNENNIFDFDTLYDLIQAGLVKKID